MNFKSAHEKLQKIANGDYNTLTYEITTSQGGGVTQVCRVYLHNYSWHSGSNWYEALLALQREINPPKVKIESIEEIKKES